MQRLHNFICITNQACQSQYEIKQNKKKSQNDLKTFTYKIFAYPLDYGPLEHQPTIPDLSVTKVQTKQKQEIVSHSNENEQLLLEV